MKLQNGGEYIESLRELKPVIYYKGKRIDDVTRHPATAPHVRCAAMTYALANEENFVAASGPAFTPGTASYAALIGTSFTADVVVPTSL